MTLAFSGRIALVTGGTGSIGSAVVAALRAQGATVVCADARGGLPIVRAHLHDDPVVALDVTSRSQLHELVQHIQDQLGPVDTLVNVAGVVSFGAASTLPEEEWDRVLDINLKGSFLASQAVAAGMKALGFGRIINMGSVVGRNAGNARPWMDPAEQDKAGNVAYGVSKAGVHSMTGFFAKELAAFGITVNAVAPGPVATAMTAAFPDNLRAMIPVQRMGQPQDIAEAVLFLARRESGFINGETLNINGGMWCG
jgi:NAD(P)-dependent dehydrogenase (short-subunit alcohol dehydrogenase family)